MIRGLAYRAASDWASLEALDAVLAQSILIDAWCPEVVSLRAAWRVNAVEDRALRAAEALALIELVLVFTADENLHRMRAIGALTLGDADRLVESSQYLADVNDRFLTASANQDRAIPAGQLEQVRQNLAAIAGNLGGELQVADPRRLADVRESVDSLIEYVDDYRPHGR